MHLLLSISPYNQQSLKKLVENPKLPSNKKAFCYQYQGRTAGGGSLGADDLLPSGAILVFLIFLNSRKRKQINSTRVAVCDVSVLVLANHIFNSKKTLQCRFTKKNYFSYKVD